MRLDATASKLQLVNNHCFFIKTTSIVSFHHRNKQFPTFPNSRETFSDRKQLRLFFDGFHRHSEPTLNPPSSSGLLLRRLTRFWKISSILPTESTLLLAARISPSMERFHHRRRLLFLPLPRSQRRPHLRRSLRAGMPCLSPHNNTYSRKSDAYVRVNVGLSMFVVSLLIVPIIDAAYLKGRVGLYEGFYVMVGAVGLSAVADALVESVSVGAAR